MTTFVKILDCPNLESINDEIQRWVETQSITGDCFWNPASVKDLMTQCPKFRSWLIESNLLISTVAITYGTKPNCCGPHIDTKPARFKLSWPVKNVMGTWNRWFRSKTQTAGQKNQLGGISYDYNDLEELYRHRLDGPCIIDAGTIHDVWCEEGTLFPRIGLQCQLYKEPTEL